MREQTVTTSRLSKLPAAAKAVAVKTLSSSVLLSIVSAFAIGALLIAATGQDPLTGYAAMFKGALGTGLGLSNTVSRATLIVCFAIATAVAFRAGIFNLGTQGQAVLGALTAALVVLFVPGPDPLVLLLALFCAVFVGASWALLAAVLQNHLAVPILISSLLLNYPAQFFSSWLINTCLQDPTTNLAGSAQFAPARTVGYLTARNGEFAASLRAQFGSTGTVTMLFTNVTWALLIVTLVVGLIVFLNNKTRYGFESGLAGQNPQFTRYGGVNPSMLVTKTMLLSGGIAGLAGALIVLSLPSTRLLDGAVVNTGYAFTALLVTLLAAFRPLATVASGVFFAAIIVGSAAMGNELGMSPQISAIIQALVIILIAFRVALPRVRKKLQTAKQAEKRSA